MLSTLCWSLAGLVIAAACFSVGIPLILSKEKAGYIGIFLGCLFAIGSFYALGVYDWIFENIPYFLGILCTANFALVVCSILCRDQTFSRFDLFMGAFILLSLNLLTVGLFWTANLL